MDVGRQISRTTRSTAGCRLKYVICSIWWQFGECAITHVLRLLTCNVHLVAGSTRCVYRKKCSDGGPHNARYRRHYAHHVSELQTG
jgi:hypothetical protein